jgi:hypothetical protein
MPEPKVSSTDCAQAMHLFGKWLVATVVGGDRNTEQSDAYHFGFDGKGSEAIAIASSGRWPSATQFRGGPGSHSDLETRIRQGKRPREQSRRKQ